MEHSVFVSLCEIVLVEVKDILSLIAAYRLTTMIINLELALISIPVFCGKNFVRYIVLSCITSNRQN